MDVDDHNGNADLGTTAAQLPTPETTPSEPQRNRQTQERYWEARRSGQISSETGLGWNDLTCSDVTRNVDI